MVFDFARIWVPACHPITAGLTIVRAMLFLPSGLSRRSTAMDQIIGRAPS